MQDLSVGLKGFPREAGIGCGTLQRQDTGGGAPKAVVPNHFGTRDWFRGKQFFHGQGGGDVSDGRGCFRW